MTYYKRCKICNKLFSCNTVEALTVFKENNEVIKFRKEYNITLTDINVFDKECNNMYCDECLLTKENVCTCISSIELQRILDKTINKTQEPVLEALIHSYLKYLNLYKLVIEQEQENTLLQIRNTNLEKLLHQYYVGENLRDYMG